MGVGLLIRFGRNPSILVGQGRTPSKLVEYQPKLFWDGFLAKIRLNSNQNSWYSSNFWSVRSSNCFEWDQIFTVSQRPTVYKPTGPIGVYRRRYKFELDRELDNPSAINVVKTSRLRYAGHMIRRPEDVPQKAIFIAKPQGTRRQGRPRSRWVDGVYSDSWALVAPVWTNRAQDREKWRDLCHKALTKYWVVAPN
jgi:hypothetical protein